VRIVNDRRKAIGLELSDRIALGIYADGPVAEAARRHQAWIAEEVLAVETSIGSVADLPQADQAEGNAVIDGKPVAIVVEKP
jgi:isoleucyl-tRNA synthetase